MLACENNNIIKCPVPKWGRLNCLQRQRNGRKDGPTNKQKAPGLVVPDSAALLFLYLIGQHLLQHVVCCQQSSTSLSKGVPISKLRGWSVFYILTYLGILFFAFFVLSFVKFVYFFRNSKKNVNASSWISLFTLNATVFIVFNHLTSNYYYSFFRLLFLF